MRKLAGIAVLLLAFPGAVALACGFCVEDKVAATYDHRVLEEAQRRGHSIAYAEIAGDAAGEPETAATVQRLVSGSAGVVDASVRVSAAPAAVSFAWNPARHDLDRLMAEMNRRLASRRLQLSLLRQWDARSGLK